MGRPSAPPVPHHLPPLLPPPNTLRSALSSCTFPRCRHRLREFRLYHCLCSYSCTACISGFVGILLDYVVRHICCLCTVSLSQKKSNVSALARNSRRAFATIVTSSAGCIIGKILGFLGVYRLYFSSRRLGAKTLELMGCNVILCAMAIIN